jgi:hypothetical protein
MKIPHINTQEMLSLRADLLIISISEVNLKTYGCILAVSWLYLGCIFVKKKIDF